MIRIDRKHIIILLFFIIIIALFQILNIVNEKNKRISDEIKLLSNPTYLEINRSNAEKNKSKSITKADLDFEINLYKTLNYNGKKITIETTKDEDKRKYLVTFDGDIECFKNIVGNISKIDKRLTIEKILYKKSSNDNEEYKILIGVL